MKRNSLDAVRHLQISCMSFDDYGRGAHSALKLFCGSVEHGFFEIERLVRLNRWLQDPFDLRSVNQTESGGKLFVDSLVSLTAIRYFDNQALTIS
jgi:hypothetical protein